MFANSEALSVIWGMESIIAPGRLLARGVQRHLRRSHDFATLDEFSPTSGLRVDVIGVGPKAEIWVVECKSSRLDYMSDSKWRGYLDWCDRFFWAVDSRFPYDLLPEDTGLIIADRHDAELVRMPEAHKLSAARRKKVLLKFARNAADRNQSQREAEDWEKIRALPLRDDDSDLL